MFIIQSINPQANAKYYPAERIGLNDYRITNNFDIDYSVCTSENVRERLIIEDQRDMYKKEIEREPDPVVIGIASFC